MDAYLVSNNGLGDNLFMNGYLNFIKQFYKNVYFLCKVKYYENVKLFFDKNSNIICLPFDETDEYNEIYKIISNKYNDLNNDIFIAGIHKKYLKSRITNREFLNTKLINKIYKIDYSTLNSNNYNFIETFYKDIKLNLTYFFEYFDLPSNDISKKLYNQVSNYYLVFIQYKSSDNKNLNISNLKNKYINDDNVLLISNDINLYSSDSKKYHLAQKFVLEKVAFYIDLIKNCDEIYLIDSCFTGIVLPLLKTNRLKAEIVDIIHRDQINKYII